MAGCKAGDKAIVIGPPNPNERCQELRKNIGKVVNVLRKSPEDTSTKLERFLTGYQGAYWTIEPANENDFLIAHVGYYIIQGHESVRLLENVPDTYLHPLRPSSHKELTDTSKDKDIPIKSL